MKKDILKKLKSLDDRYLFDIITNYKKYKYTEEVKRAAIRILKERGVPEEEILIVQEDQLNREGELHRAIDILKSMRFRFRFFGLLAMILYFCLFTQNPYFIPFFLICTVLAVIYGQSFQDALNVELEQIKSPDVRPFKEITLAQFFIHLCLFPLTLFPVYFVYSERRYSTVFNKLR